MDAGGFDGVRELPLAGRGRHVWPLHDLQPPAQDDRLPRAAARGHFVGEHLHAHATGTHILLKHLILQGRKCTWIEITLEPCILVVALRVKALAASYP